MKPMKVYVEPNFLHLVKTTTKKTLYEFTEQKQEL